MNDKEFSDLSNPELDRIDSICDRFEKAIRDGSSPSFEEYLGEVEDNLRQSLLRELLATEFGCLRYLGQQPSIEEYESRFPELFDFIERVFHETFDQAESLPVGHQHSADERSGRSSPKSGVPSSQKPFPKLPNYQVLAQLGQGGMGTVYQMRDERLDRLVAVKMLSARNPSDAELARFRAEAEVTARLHHPGIVQIFDVGEHQGDHYLVMEFVDGGTLQQFTGGRPQPPRLAARLLESISRSLHHAHEQGVIHRDLKPSNILLARRTASSDSSDPLTISCLAEDHGQLVAVNPEDVANAKVIPMLPKISDFGLAKLLGSEDQTRTGAVLGTLGYMSPEQSVGQGRIARETTDVYSLGAVLYYLLTGRPPFLGRTPMETLLFVRDDEPLPPSRLQPNLPRDLETICLKCLQKEPHRRYGSAAELSADLRRFIADEPIQARPVSRLQKSWQWCRRNRALATSCGLLAMALLLGVAGIAWQWRSALIARELAATQRDTYRWREAELAFSRARKLAEEQEVSQSLAWMLESLALSTADRPHFQRMIRINLSAWSQFVPQRVYASDSIRGTYTADGRTLYVATAAGKLLRIDPLTGDSSQLPFETKSQIQTLAIHPSAPILAIAVKSSSGCDVQFWNIDEGRLLDGQLAHEGAMAWISFSEYGGRLFTFQASPPSIRVWDVSERRLVLGPLVPPSINRAELSPDLRRLLTVGSGNGQFWDTDTLRPSNSDLVMDRGEWIHNCFPDGRSLLLRRDEPDSHRCYLRSVDTQSRRTIWKFELPFLPDDSHVRITPNGRMLVTTGEDRVLRLIEIPTGRQFGPPVRGTAQACLAFGADGQSMLTSQGVYRMPRAWSRVAEPLGPANTTRSTKIVAGEGRHRTTVVYDRRRQLVVTRNSQQASHAAAARVWNAETGQTMGPPISHRVNHVRAIAVSPDGQFAASGAQLDGVYAAEVLIWKTDDVTSLHRLACSNYVSALCFSPRAQRLAVGDYNGHVTMYDPATGQQVGDTFEHPEIVWSLAFSRDGKYLAVGTTSDFTRSPHVRVWDTFNGQAIAEPLAHESYVESVEFGSGGTLLTGDRRHARLWNISTGQPMCEPLLHEGALHCLRFSPSQQRFATGSEDGLVRLFDGKTGERIGRLMRHHAPILDIDFSPDGNTIAAGASDGSVCLWDLHTYQPLGPAFSQNRAIHGVAFSPDGAYVLSTAEDGMTRRWPMPTPAKGTTHELRRELIALTSLELDANLDIERVEQDRWQSTRLHVMEQSSSLELGKRIGERDWHRSRAQDAEQDRDSFGTIWHLDRLIAIEPENWSYYARRGRAHVWSNDLGRAKSDYDRAEKCLSSNNQQQLLSDWYRHCIQVGRRAEDWESLVWYLDRVLAHDPNDWQLFALRMEAHDKLGQRQQAADDFVSALEHSLGDHFLPRLADSRLVADNLEVQRNVYHRVATTSWLSVDDWCRYVMLELKLGNVDAYRRISSQLTERIGDATVSPQLAIQLARLCSVGPCEREHAEVVTRLVQRVLDDDPTIGPMTDPMLTAALGRVLYRADRSAEAIVQLRQAVEAGSEVELGWLFLSMAHNQLGETDVAEACFENVETSLSSSDISRNDIWHNLEADIVRSEIEDLLDRPTQ